MLSFVFLIYLQSIDYHCSKDLNGLVLLIKVRELLNKILNRSIKGTNITHIRCAHLHDSHGRCFNR
jgi:hypothetical protein